MKDVTQKSAGRGDESAFPQPSDGHSTNGLTIREHFAGLAMQGLISAGASIPATGGGPSQACMKFASAAVELADALIDELSRVSP